MLNQQIFTNYYVLSFLAFDFHIFQKARNEPDMRKSAWKPYNTFFKALYPMGKKYQTKKLKKHLQEDNQLYQESHGLQSPGKEKKIIKEPRTKDTILSDIELQIVDMFSRSFSNGQIGVKYPQQKKKGMMRLMNFCFRTIMEETELYISPALKKDANLAKGIDKRQRTIFYLSSNYRYKHIEKSLLEDFKIVCRNYVKYHCLEHMDPKFVERFYKKVIFNDFSANVSDVFKNLKEVKFDPVQPEEENLQLSSSQIPIKKASTKSPKKTAKTEVVDTTGTNKKTGAKRGRKKKNYVPEPTFTQEILAHQKGSHQIELASKEPNEREMKSNKICIQKINIYLGYDTKTMGRKQGHEEDLTKIHTHPYARMEVQENQNKYLKRKWTNDMESELIDQFMNTSATSPNIIIRNLMKKFGRNKLFVESEIITKRKEMFKTSVTKFITAFEGKTLCSEEAVRKMEICLRGMSLSPKNYFIASFIHDFYFKDVQGISVTLLSEYVHKLSREQGMSEKGFSHEEQDYEEESIKEKKKILERQDLKYALNTMSKMVSNYSYDLAE